MKKLLNTLYVTTQGTYLARDGETVLVRLDGADKIRLPLHTLDGIVCFGRVSCSPPLMELCCNRNVSISFMSGTGRFWARVQGPVSGNVLLRREQYRRADDPERCAQLARMLILGKVANTRTVLLRALRDHPELTGGPAIENAAARLARTIKHLTSEMDLAEVRGHEGETAKVYFNVFDHLITAQKDDFYFERRSRRPPMDKLNAMLSFLYTLLTHDAASALEAVGLDPAVGYLHRDRPGRPGLALDLMEELRPFIADRLALSLINRKQVNAQGFRDSETGACLMDDETRKKVITAYQKRKQEEIHHPFLTEKIAVGLIPHAQALLLSRYLRGDLDAYPPFFWK